jgi:hypothetical protein
MSEQSTTLFVLEIIITDFAGDVDESWRVENAPAHCTMEILLRCQDPITKEERAFAYNMSCNKDDGLTSINRLLYFWHAKKLCFNTATGQLVISPTLPTPTHKRLAHSLPPTAEPEF